MSLVGTGVFVHAIKILTYIEIMWFLKMIIILYNGLNWLFFYWLEILQTVAGIDKYTPKDLYIFIFCLVHETNVLQFPYSKPYVIIAPIKN